MSRNVFTAHAEKFNQTKRRYYENSTKQSVSFESIHKVQVVLINKPK